MRKFIRLRKALLSAILCLAAADHGKLQSGEKMKQSYSSVSGYSVTYIGHATVLLRIGGTVFLTDPLYADRIGIYPRCVPPGRPLGSLPPLDAVIISHSHWDHFNRPTLQRLKKNVPIIVPDGLQVAICRLGFTEVRNLKNWEKTEVKGAEITAVPVKHWGTSCGYLIRKGKTVYFAGDTGLFPGMADIGSRHPVDLALLPIGAYRPHFAFIPWTSRAMRRVHMAPEDIPEAMSMLKAKTIVPIHWGTFKLTGEPVEEPMERLRRVISERKLRSRVRIVPHGETITF